MAKIIIPTPLRKFTDNQSTYNAGGSTVKEAILELTNTFGGLKQHLYDANQNIRSFIRIYVGDEDINTLEREATIISSDSVISIIPAIAGGSGE